MLNRLLPPLLLTRNTSFTVFILLRKRLSAIYNYLALHGMNVDSVAEWSEAIYKQ